MQYKYSLSSLRLQLNLHRASALLHFLLAALASYLSVYHREHIYHRDQANTHRLMIIVIKDIIRNRRDIARINKLFPPAW